MAGKMNQFVRIAVMMVSMGLSRLVDTSNPDTLFKVRVAYVVCVLLNTAVFYYIRTVIRRTHDDTKIYIVNRMLGQEMVEETTYFEKEETMCTQTMTGAVSSIAMSLGLMSFKMGLHYGLVMYMIQLPFNIYTNPLFQKYILNKKLDHPWNEQTELPISKMTKDESSAALKKEIVKVWDDGEVANYEKLVLLCRKSDVNTQTESGWTALMVVMGNPLGDTKTVGTLLQLGADPLLQDGEGWNALHWAAFHSNVGAVEVMMESASASVLHMLVQKNKEGLTPLELAEKEQQEDFVAWLRAAVKDEMEVMKDLNKSIDQGTEKLLVPLLEDKEEDKKE